MRLRAMDAGPQERLVVLVVDPDAEERERLGSWLDGSGFDVLTCPGPSGPDYQCVGGRGEQCPLVDPADVVVLDLWLEGDVLLVGTTAVELLDNYILAGKSVVALGHGDFMPDPFAGDAVVHLERHPRREELVEAVRLSVPAANEGDAELL